MVTLVSPRQDVSAARAYRLDSIDMLRGLVIVIMAIDHVRDYIMIGAEQDPMANPDIGAALFATRWITHFCAPVFVLLAGASAGLMAARKAPSELGRFLLTRGLWLIAVEWFVISTAWTFAPWGIEEIGGRVMVPLQVIWAIGASMVVLAGAQFLGRKVCLLAGAAIIAGHNLLDPIWPSTTFFTEGLPWWAGLHSQAGYVLGPFFLMTVYPVLPWIGVMLFGYGTAGIFEAPPASRDSRLARWGLTAVGAFLVARALGVYGDPNPWQLHAGAVATGIDFLNVTKYPPSLVYLLMTLGPAAIVCSRADRVPERVRRPLIVFGRVPFAFYVAHLYLIHSISVGLGWAQGFDVRELLTINVFFPRGYGLALPAVYLVWALVILILYPLCRWVAAVKARRRDWWLSYV